MFRDVLSLPKNDRIDEASRYDEHDEHRVVLDGRSSYSRSENRPQGVLHKVP